MTGAQVAATPFERAVIGALVLLSPEPRSRFTEQEVSSAVRAVALFLDESTSAEPVVDARIGQTPYPHRHDWIAHAMPSGAVLAACSLCGHGTQLV